MVSFRKTCMVYTYNFYFYAGMSHLFNCFDVIWCNTRSVSSDVMTGVDADAGFVE